MSLPSRSTGASYDALGKINDQNNPPANDQLQWNNPSLARGICDVAALGLVSPRFTCRFTTAITTGGLVLLTTWANWSNVTLTLPKLARSDFGVFTITVPPTVSDEYDASFNNLNTISVNFIGAFGNFESQPGIVTCNASGNVINVNTFTTSGTPSDLIGSNLFIVAY
jgi:hypothetical protein